MAVLRHGMKSRTEEVGMSSQRLEMAAAILAAEAVAQLVVEQVRQVREQPGAPTLRPARDGAGAVGPQQTDL